MKKTVLLFAISFVLVAFLSAQNDCSENSNTQKAKKETPANYHDANQTNSTKCSKSVESEDLERMDGFTFLLVKDPGTKPVDSWGFVVPGSEMSMGNVSYKKSQGDLYSASGSRLCCSPPPPDYPRYNPAKKH